MTLNDDPTAPRGVRNNNPGNIRHAGRIVWLGELAPDKEGYCVFSSPTYGVRALYIVFRTYQEVHRLNTPRLMISRWAPASENDVAAYVEDVCSRIGCYADLPYDLTLKGISWCQAIVRHEVGSDPYLTDIYVNAIDMANLR